MSETKREFKECVLVDGVIWSVGPWDYQYRQVQVDQDEEGNPIYEQQEMNPLPENAIIDHRWFRYTLERGWYEEGTEPLLSFNDHVNRSIAELYSLLVQKKIIVVDEVPAYNEYDFKSEVTKKMSESDA